MSLPRPTSDHSKVEHLVASWLVTFPDSVYVQTKLVHLPGGIVDEANHVNCDQLRFIGGLKSRSRGLGLKAVKDDATDDAPNCWGILAALSSSTDRVEVAMLVEQNWSLQEPFSTYTQPLSMFWPLQMLRFYEGHNCGW
jgi:hypothetical protein